MQQLVLFFIGEYCFSAGIVNVNCHPLGQQVDVLAMLHRQYCCKDTYPIPFMLQSHWIHVCLLVSNVCIPCSTLAINSAFLSLLHNLLVLQSKEICCLAEFCEWLHDFTNRMGSSNLVNETKPRLGTCDILWDRKVSNC